MSTLSHLRKRYIRLTASFHRECLSNAPSNVKCNKLNSEITEALHDTDVLTEHYLIGWRNLNVPWTQCE